MSLLGHIGNIPVEEWLPFVAPVVVLYLVGRRATRKRAQQVEQLPPPAELLDEPTVAKIVHQWTRSKHRDLDSRHVAIFYPPGPEGRSVSELAQQTKSDAKRLETLLDELGDLGYLELEQPDGAICLTVAGYDVMSEMESVLLETVKQRETAAAQLV